MQVSGNYDVPKVPRDPLRGTQPGLGRHTCSPVPRPRVKKQKNKNKNGSGNFENKCSLKSWVWHGDMALQRAAVGMVGGSGAHREVSPMGSQGSCCFKSHNHYERRK